MYTFCEELKILTAANHINRLWHVELFGPIRIMNQSRSFKLELIDLINEERAFQSELYEVFKQTMINLTCSICYET